MVKRKNECNMNLIAESSINGLKIFLFGDFYIVEHEQKDKQLVTEFKRESRSGKMV